MPTASLDRTDPHQRPRTLMGRALGAARSARLQTVTMLLRGLRPLLSRRGAVLIVPPTSPGSLGDDAMICALTDTLRQQGADVIALTEERPTNGRRFNARADEAVDLSTYFRRKSDPVQEAEKFLRSTRRYRHLFVLGADVLDGFYSARLSTRRLALAMWAARAGMQVTLVGFSYNDAPHPSAIEAMRQLPRGVRVCPRDPVSAARLERYTGRGVTQVADMAFLLQPSAPDDDELVGWIQQAKLAGRELIGMNLVYMSRFVEESSERSLDRFLEFYVALVESIASARPSAQFVFLAHDYRPNGVGEAPLLARLHGMLNPLLRAQCHLPTAEYSAAEIKWLCGELDFVISSRMHLAIAAIGQGTPVFSFEYQGKFEGLYALLGHPELLSSMEQALSAPDAVRAKVLEAIRRAPALRASFRARLPLIQELSRRNVELSD